MTAEPTQIFTVNYASLKDVVSSFSSKDGVANVLTIKARSESDADLLILLAQALMH